MKNIVLLCSAGMSTSMLVKKMREAAAEQGFECHIEAYGISEASAVVPDAHCVLLGPQVRFHLQKIQTNHPTVPMGSIDMSAYGLMDGKKVLKQAKALMGEE